jgi:fumarate reductase flavoprotein subunit
MLTSSIHDVQDYDLVVIGAGIAGLTAATTAAEAGLAVCLVEKLDTIGGSSAMSGGWFAFSDTAEQQEAGVEDSAELFRQDLLKVGGHLNNERLIDAYLEHQREAYEWLKDHGAVFREVEISSGQSARRGHNTDIKELLEKIHGSYTAAGGVTLFSARAQRLLTDRDQVTGVEITTGESTRKLRGSSGVILASGGFSRSSELLRIFAPEQLAAIPYGGAGNSGDGLKMAWKLGAGMADMSFISGTYGSHPDTTDEFHELLTAYYMGAIIVNQEGRRFVDESQSYKTLGRVVLNETDGLGFQIFDADIRAQSHRGIPLKDMDTLEDLGHIYSGETLEELADKAGIDPVGLRCTVDSYNQALEDNGHDEVGRTHLCNGVGDLVPIKRAPFYAYPAKSLMTTTYCGLTVDPVGRVLDVFGEQIQGLYAAGEITGGFHGAAYMTGSSLGKGAVFGHRIAKRIVEDAMDSMKVNI